MPETENSAGIQGTGTPGVKAGPTFGERAVRRSFNPGGNTEVDVIKAMAAALIDRCNNRRIHGASTELGREQARCYSLAITAFEEGAMWAVKAATTGQP